MVWPTMTTIRPQEGVWRPYRCTVVIFHLASTKKRVVIVQKIKVLEYILACHIGPDQAAAVIMVRASPNGPYAPLRPLLWHHGLVL